MLLALTSSCLFSAMIIIMYYGRVSMKVEHVITILIIIFIVILGSITGCYVYYRQWAMVIFSIICNMAIIVAFVVRIIKIRQVASTVEPVV